MVSTSLWSASSSRCNATTALCSPVMRVPLSAILRLVFNAMANHQVRELTTGRPAVSPAPSVSRRRGSHCPPRFNRDFNMPCTQFLEASPGFPHLRSACGLRGSYHEGAVPPTRGYRNLRHDEGEDNCHA